MWKGHLIGHLELQTWKLSLTWNHHSYNLINYKLFEEQRSCPPHLCTSLDVWHIVGNQEIFINLIWSTDQYIILQKCVIHNWLYEYVHLLQDFGKSLLSSPALSHWGKWRVRFEDLCSSFQLGKPKCRPAAHVSMRGRLNVRAIFLFALGAELNISSVWSGGGWWLIHK